MEATKMKFVRTRKVLPMDAIDEVTGKQIMLIVDPPGRIVGIRPKQSKQTYTLTPQELLNAGRSARGEDFTLAKPFQKPKVQQEPSSRELIKEVLAEHHKLHFSQVRQQLKNKGLEVSKRIMGDLMSMMHESGQVEQDGMYYSLKKVS